SHLYNRKDLSPIRHRRQLFPPLHQNRPALQKPPSVPSAPAHLWRSLEENPPKRQSFRCCCSPKQQLAPVSLSSLQQSLSVAILPGLSPTRSCQVCLWPHRDPLPYLVHRSLPRYPSGSSCY